MINRIRLLIGNESIIGCVVFVVTFSVYHTTMCPTVSFTDSGELATVASTLGIAHPTGYPLWTLIGRLAAMVPFGNQEIVRLNVLAGVLTALAVAFFFKLVLIVYRFSTVFRFKRKTVHDEKSWIVKFGAFITALTFGFSSTIWAQSVEIEVYALHVLLVVIVTLYFISGIEEQLTDPQRISRRLFLFAYVLGLSFANHMTTILLAPGFLYLYFTSLGSNKKSWRIIAALAPFFLLGLTCYSYLLIRSMGGPVLDWGHPVTLERFWWHVTGKQYQTWMFSGWDVVSKQFNYFVSNFPTEFQWQVVVFILIGLIETFYQSKRLLVFIILLFGTCLAYSVNFDIHEIDPYFILAYFACGCLLAIAARSLLEWCGKAKQKILIPVAVIVLAALPAIQVLSNRSDVDQSENYQAVTFVHDVFSQVEPNAVVFSSLWDYFMSPSYYLQIIRKERPDVVLVDEELLQNRTWYFIQLERDHPEILAGSQAKVTAFLIELRRFERGEPFEFSTINSRWTALLEDLVTKLLRDHPVYVDSRIAGQFSQNFEEVPEGLLVRLTRKGNEGVWKPISARLGTGTFSNYVTSDLKRYYASMYTFHSYWLVAHRRLPEALENLDEALRVEPSFPPALNLKASISRLPR
jgi:hypothetical protein